MGFLGKALGAVGGVVGGIYGGSAGAAIGSKIGGAVGGAVDGKKDNKQPQQVASAQQPSIFQNNGSASSSTVKMEIPADKAGQVANFITQA